MYMTFHANFLQAVAEAHLFECTASVPPPCAPLSDIVGTGGGLYVA